MEIVKKEQSKPQGLENLTVKKTPVVAETPTKSLEAEARKYKSADEFVKSN